MKYIFTAVCMLVVSAFTYASDVKLNELYPSPPKNGLIKEQIGFKQTDAKTTAIQINHNWVDLGLCDYVDDIATSLFMVDPVRFKVKVQQDEANPGFYRIVDPWANYPYKEQVVNDPDCPGTFSEGDSYYILIDTTDPDYVRMLESPLGVDDGYGEGTAFSLTELVGEVVGAFPLKQEDADKSAGKLTDNVITFPVIRALAIEQDGSYYAANGNGAFALALPGGTLGVDYDLTISVTEALCPDKNGDYHISVSGDSYISSVRYALLSEKPDDIPADFATTATQCSINSEVTINVKGQTGRLAYALFVSYDEDGEARYSTIAPLDIPDENSSEWVYYGKADMTEGFLSCVYPSLFTVHTYEVEIEHRADNPRIYRIVNPYSGYWENADAYSLDHGHNHYIYINAENGDNVYVEYSPLGISIPGNGECAISSDYYELINQYGLDHLVTVGIYSGGHLKDNVLTFDNSCDVKILPVDYGKWVYTNRFINPDYDPETMTGMFDEYLAGDFKLDLSKAASGIEDITVETPDIPCEYYNLQGIKVGNASHGIFIVRQGDKSVKKHIR